MEPTKASGVRPDGTADAAVVEYYRKRAGAGLIVSQVFSVSRQARGYLRSPGLFTEAHRDSWREVAAAVHAEGGCIFAQLGHSGRLTHEEISGEAPVAPSPVAPNGPGYGIRTGMEKAPVPQELTHAQIRAIIADTQRSAELALEAGFDGIELHGANGYLVSQFLSTNANLRRDEYGGHFENRARFALQLLEALVRVTGAKRLGLKLSPLKFSLYDVEEGDASKLNPYLAARCSELGLAYLNVQRPEGDTVENLAQVNVLDFVRPHFKGLLIACGNFMGYADAEACLRANEADMIGFGRAFAEDEAFLERLGTRSGKPLEIGHSNPVIVRAHKPQNLPPLHPSEWHQKPWKP